MRNKPKISNSSINNLADEIKIESVTDFVSAVSHDLKNPLAAIKAYVHIAKKRIQEIGDMKATQYLEKIDEQTDRATHLITELLDTSKITGGKIVIHKKPFSLDKLIKEVIQDVQVTTNTHKIITEYKTKIKIKADKERIRRVIINLLTNAIKYSPGKDKVMVTIDLDKQNAIVSIQDFGVGISMTKQKHLFDPYFRVSEKGNNLTNGHGLGLPIVKKIVDTHGGKVWLESKKGKGSTFYFALPLN